MTIDSYISKLTSILRIKFILGAFLLVPFLFSYAGKTSLKFFNKHINLLSKEEKNDHKQTSGLDKPKASLKN